MVEQPRKSRLHTCSCAHGVHSRALGPGHARLAGLNRLEAILRWKVDCLLVHPPTRSTDLDGQGMAEFRAYGLFTVEMCMGIRLPAQVVPLVTL